MKYVIYSPDATREEAEPMFWSNNEGWGTLGSATHFSKDESKRLDLPLQPNGNKLKPEGVWMKLYEAEKLVEYA